MNRLHPLMLAELLKTAPDVNMVFEVNDLLTVGTTVRFSRGPVGHSIPLITQWGEVSFVLSGWRSSLVAPTLSVTMDDTAGQISLKYGRNHRGKRARARLIGRKIPSFAWHTWFDGVIDGTPKNSNSMIFNCRMNDDVTRQTAPQSKIRPNMFPDLPGTTDLLGKALPYMVGNHDSTGINALGMIKGLFVGSPSAGKFRYLVCSGWWASIVRVFSAGVQMLNPGDYIVVRALTRDARKVTLIEFSATQGTKEILLDVQDLQSAPGPATSLHQLAADIGWSDFRGDHAELSVAPLNPDSVTLLDDFLVTVLGLSRSYFVKPERKTMADVFKEFLDSFNAQAFWDRDGSLVLLPWNISLSSYITDGRQILDSEHFEGDPSFPEDTQGTAVQIAAVAGRRPSDDANLNSRTGAVQKTGQLDRVRDAKYLWLPATAESVGNIQYLIANGSSNVSHFTAVPAGNTIHGVLSQGPPPIDAIRDAFGRPVTYIVSDSAAMIGAGDAILDVSLSDMPRVVAVANMTVFLNAVSNGGASSGDEDLLGVYIVIGGMQYPSGYPAAGSQFILGISGPVLVAISIPTLDPSTGVAWTQAGLNAVGLRVVWTPSNGAGALDGSKRVELAQVYGAVSYTAAANVSPASLAIVSRDLWHAKTTPQQIQVGAPLSFLDYGPGDDVPLVDARLGWHRATWRQGIGRIVGFTVKAQLPGVSLLIEDVKSQQTSLWIQGVAFVGVDGASAAGNGMALITNGMDVSVARDSPDYLDDPAGEGVQDAGPVVRIFSNCWPSERRGTLVQRTGKNMIKRSSFVSSGTGLTPSAGSGTLTFPDTVGTQLFVDTNTTAQHLLMTAGSPHTTETRETWPESATFDVGGSHSLTDPSVRGVVSLDYACSSAVSRDGPSWRAVRTTDGFYWNDTSGAWQAGVHDNPLPASLVWTRSRSKILSIDDDDDARTMTLSVSLPAGGTPNRTVEVGHFQLDQGFWRTSRIVTDAAAPVSRAASVVTIANDKRTAA